MLAWRSCTHFWKLKAKNQYWVRWRLPPSHVPYERKGRYSFIHPAIQCCILCFVTLVLCLIGQFIEDVSWYLLAFSWHREHIKSDIQSLNLEREKRPVWGVGRRQQHRSQSSKRAPRLCRLGFWTSLRRDWSDGKLTQKTSLRLKELSPSNVQIGGNVWRIRLRCFLRRIRKWAIMKRRAFGCAWVEQFTHFAFFRRVILRC